MDLTTEEIATIYAQGPEAVAALVNSLLAQIAVQEELIAQLSARVQELEDHQSRTSHNSHQPPASDGFNKQPRSLRTRSGKAPGGQPGHSGHTLTLTDTPDELLTHRPDHCADCGTALNGLPPSATQRRQVVDLPPLQLYTVEHQVESVPCPHCGAISSGEFPAEAAEPVQYGPRILALGVYLRYYQLLPSARTSELLADLFGASPSEGTLNTALAVCAAALAPVVEAIRQALLVVPVAHFDETGCYVEDKRYWLHVVCTAKLTYYHIDRRRGEAGMRAGGVLPNFRGTAVHDAYASYWRFACRHALCNAHLLRDLLFVVERYKQGWAQGLADLLREMLAAVEEARAAEAGALSAAQVADFAARYAALVGEGLAANPPAEAPPEQGRGKVKQSKAYNLLVRLRDHAGEVLRFVSDLRVPFDNNQAERDLRMMKVQQKISGRFRTQEGALGFGVIRSYISTLRKQDQPVLSALEQAFRGSPLFPATNG